MKTKKLFLAVAVSFTTFSTALAQDSDFGIKAGVNYSTLSGNEEAGIEYLLGFHAGLIAEFELSPRFAIQPELVYSLEGTESAVTMEEDDFFFSSEQKIKLGYLNLPLMAKFYVTEGLSLQAGPQISYLLSGKNEYTISSNMGEDLEVNESGTEDIKEDLKSFSFGLNFGLGYEFSSLFLQARYHLGVTDINDFQPDPEDEVDVDLGKIKNSGFQLSVGYKF